MARIRTLLIVVSNLDLGARKKAARAACTGELNQLGRSSEHSRCVHVDAPDGPSSEFAPNRLGCSLKSARAHAQQSSLGCAGNRKQKSGSIYKEQNQLF